jgi:hypothetical protein
MAPLFFLGFLMASEVDICNSALNMVGASNIISLTEDSRAARLCNQRYEFLRDSVFRSHPWNALLRRAELAKDTTTPSWEYASQYQLPTDPFCLRVLEVEGESDGVEYAIEGRFLLTDEDVVKIKYVARVTDPNEYDTLLIETLAAAIAADISYPLANSLGLQQQMNALYEAKLREARFTDATEGTPDTIESQLFLESRL